MKKMSKNSNFYIIIAFIIMAILFYSSSQTYEQQSQVGTINHLLKGQPFKEQLTRISFVYAGDEVSIQAKGYSKFVEFF